MVWKLYRIDTVCCRFCASADITDCNILSQKIDYSEFYAAAFCNIENYKRCCSAANKTNAGILESIRLEINLSSMPAPKNANRLCMQE